VFDMARLKPPAVSRTRKPVKFSEEDMYNYQNMMVDHIIEHPMCALWVDMGLGKTVGTLTALTKLQYSFDVSKTLVTAPLRVARKVWADEIDAWAHTRSLNIVHMVGTPEQRLAAMDQEADIYTINNENMTWLVGQHVHERKMVRRWKWDSMVIDESSCYQSHASHRFNALKKVRRFMGRIIELTGTPGDLLALWSQIFLLDRGERLGINITAYRTRWFNPPSQYEYGWTPKPHAEKEIMALIGDLAMSLRAEDWLELPEVMYNPIMVEMTPAQWKDYKRMERRYMLKVKGKKITAVNAGVLSGKLLQLANGAVYTTSPDWVAFHDHKIEALLEVLSLATGPVMVVYNFKSDLVRIKEALTKAKIKWDVLSDEASEDRFNAGKTPVLIMHPKSAGHGLNLQHGGAQELIWFGLNWSLELFLQANARLIGGLRRGHGVVIHVIAAEGTIDLDVICTLDDKERGQDRRMNMLKKRVAKA